jgi:hypothetical protein
MGAMILAALLTPVYTIANPIPLLHNEEQPVADTISSKMIITTITGNNQIIVREVDAMPPLIEESVTTRGDGTIIIRRKTG